MTPLSRACVCSYQYSIVTVSLSCTVSDIFTSSNGVPLKSVFLNWLITAGWFP